MASLKAILGLIPKTSEVEAKRAALKREYEAFLDFEKSEELEEFIKLENKVTSAEFAQRKKEIQAQKYKDTEEYRKEQEYLRLKKEKDISNYYKIKNSEELKDLRAFEESDELKKYHQLEEYLKTPEFLKVKEYMALSPKKKFENSDLFKTLQQYNDQRKSLKIRNYLKFINHKGYTDYQSLNNSSRLKEFEELREYVKSGDFLSARRSMKKSDFKLSEEYRKYQQYTGLKNSREFKNYFKLTSMHIYSDYKELHDSQEMEAFNELEKYINSSEYKTEKSRIESQKFQDTDEYRKQEEYNNLGNSKRFKNNFKFKVSALYANYLNLDESDRISQFEDKEKVIQSDKFREVKEYMLLPPVKKLELSDEYKLEQKYNELKKSDKIVWYYQLKDSTRFDDLKKWEITFEDDFSANALDRKKWMTKYFWGDAILNESYALAHERHIYTDGENLEIDNGVLKIITRKQEAKGKVWNPQIGFFPKDFDYTSGLISTGNSYRQKYGIFEAKIRFNKSTPVNHAFWMLSNQVIPHIDIAKAEKKLVMSNFWGNPEERKGIQKKISKLGISRFTKDFYIYSLEWSEQKLVWKINGVTVASSSQGIPNEPMYLILSSGIYKDIKGNNLPATMEVDWVRCYQKV
jgi:hypothetical protein